MSNIHTLDDIKKEPTVSEPPDQLINQRNTVIGPGLNCQKKRAWRFTLNNYTRKEVNQLVKRKFIFRKQNMEIEKYLFQEELGEKNDVPHLQGCLYFKSRVSLACLKALLHRANFAPSQNWYACLNYCSKEFTRNGEVWRYGCKENRKVVPKVIEGIYSDKWEKYKMRHIEAMIAARDEGLCLEIGHEWLCKCSEKKDSALSCASVA